jgi:hypothetical protein
LFAPFLLGIRGNPLERFEDEVPISLDAMSQRRRIERERTAAGQFEDVFINGKRRGDVAVREIFLEGAF